MWYLGQTPAAPETAGYFGLRKSNPNSRRLGKVLTDTWNNTAFSWGVCAKRSGPLAECDGFRSCRRSSCRTCYCERVYAVKCRVRNEPSATFSDCSGGVPGGHQQHAELWRGSQPVREGRAGAGVGSDAAPRQGGGRRRGQPGRGTDHVKSIRLHFTLPWCGFVYTSFFHHTSSICLFFLSIQVIHPFFTVLSLSVYFNHQTLYNATLIHPSILLKHLSIHQPILLTGYVFIHLFLSSGHSSFLCSIHLFCSKPSIHLSLHPVLSYSFIPLSKNRFI